MALESGVLVARAKVSGASRAQWKRVRSGFFGAAGGGAGPGAEERGGVFKGGTLTTATSLSSKSGGGPSTIEPCVLCESSSRRVPVSRESRVKEYLPAPPTLLGQILAALIVIVFIGRQRERQ